MNTEQKMREALHRISLASQNSMSSKEECRRIAREALAEQPTQVEAVAQVNVVDLGAGMTRLDWQDASWWHRLAAGTHTLYTAPPAPIVSDELKIAIKWAVGVCHDEGWDRTDTEKKHLSVLKRVYLDAAPEVKP